MTCPSCGTDNPATAKFCVECGTPMARRCSACGTPYDAGQKFCAECGAPLGEPVAIVGEPASAAESVVAERRLVSVLFADLVGFTTLSEARDAEDVRELLSRYFEQARTMIERYGGVVEKFIGDAVMAVWGAPVAKEDDAERAVRAALDLLQTVSGLGEEVGAPDLRARAGVLTGEAAVTLGAEGEGMVAGDLVNTASRIQSSAEPGTVLVGESTKRASEAAIVFEPAGVHELKGKAEPVQLYRALRVVAGARGALRSTGLEAPFVGRDRELRLLKELFHASAEERKAQLVTVTGIAGIGKTRLSWEFEKYVDGLAEDLWWHRGRCLSYGEGVAYWALAEMVRMRCGIVEDEDPVTARGKLSASIEEYILDTEERRWVEPRLAHLLGLEEGAPGDQENLFSAWRILFERLAEQAPTILVFEDMQWADTGLLDFLEYLLEWSRGHPVYVLALSRPELADKRPTWGAGKRSFTSLYLEPLSAQGMNDLLTGLVPGLPEDLRERILERAEGIPLYAVETVRMLLDRGLLKQEGNTYRPTGPIEALDVPETLHALVAARLDSLTADERRIVQDGSVLGKTFTKQGLRALTGLDEDELEPLLTSLLRKEVLSIQADPRSPERGQYSFLQDIVKRVAYDTISKKERREKHIAAAEFLLSLWGGEEHEIAEVVATHFVDAFNAAPEAADAEQIRERAREMLVRAGDRAASLAATTEAQRAFERAAELSGTALVQADLHERAGMMAFAGGRAEEATSHFERSIALFEAENETHPAARVSARLAEVMWDRGRLEEGLQRMDHSFQLLSTEEPDADLATLAAQLGRFMFFGGETALARERIETALELAEALWLPETLSHALNTKAVMLIAHGRAREGLALLRYALDVALEHDKPSAALRAYYNLADTLGRMDRYEEDETCVREGLALARRVGNRNQEWAFLGQIYALFCLGKWQELLDMFSQLPVDRWTEARSGFGGPAFVCVAVNAHRGELEEAERLVSVFAEMERSSDAQERGAYTCGRAHLLFSRGDYAGALAAAEGAFATGEAMGAANEAVKEAWVIGAQAALALDDVGKVEELIDVIEQIPPGQLSPYYEAQGRRFRAALLARQGEGDEAERLFKRAAGLFLELSMPFHRACALLEHGEWLMTLDRSSEAEPLLAEAREIFEGLEANPWLERLDAALPLLATP